MGSENEHLQTRQAIPALLEPTFCWGGGWCTSKQGNFRWRPPLGEKTGDVSASASAVRNNSSSKGGRSGRTTKSTGYQIRLAPFGRGRRRCGRQPGPCLPPTARLLPSQHMWACVGGGGCHHWLIQQSLANAKYLCKPTHRRDNHLPDCRRAAFLTRQIGQRAQFTGLSLH